MAGKVKYSLSLPVHCAGGTPRCPALQWLQAQCFMTQANGRFVAFHAQAASCLSCLHMLVMCEGSWSGRALTG